ncbi:MAG: TolB family protein [Bacillota bacterium]
MSVMLLALLASACTPGHVPGDPPANTGAANDPPAKVGASNDPPANAGTAVATRPEEAWEEAGEKERLPYRSPSGDEFELGSSGLAYQVNDIYLAINGIFMQVDATGPGKGAGLGEGGGSGAGAPKTGTAEPPKVRISEKEDIVTFRFEEVSLPQLLEERLLDYETPFAKVVGIESGDDFTDVAVRVTGEYSLDFSEIIPGKFEFELNAPLGSLAVNIRFQPAFQDGELSGSTDLLSAVTYLDPQARVRSVPVDDYVYTHPEGTSSVSPGGNYIGTVVGSGYKTIAAFPLRGNADPVVIYRLEDGQGIAALVFAGWRSEAECLFILSGVQPDGEHQGEEGVSVRVGDLTTATSYEAGFMADTRWQMSWMTADGRHLYVRVSKHLLEFDVQAKRLRIATELPGYETYISARPSPSGRQVIYRPDHPERRGLAMLDLDTGTDRMLVSDGDTLNFDPSWSPDGSMIAVYTADRLPAKPGEPAEYDIAIGENSELPMSRRINILKPSGETVLSIEASKGYCYGLNWAPDSSAVSYAEGYVSERPRINGPEFVTERVVLHRIPGRVEGLEGHPEELIIELLPPTGFLPVPSEGQHQPSVGGASLYYVDRNGDLMRLSGSLLPETVRDDTEVYFWEPMVPANVLIGDQMVCLVRDPDSNGNEIWLLGPDSAKRLVAYGGSATGINVRLLGLNGNTIVLSRSATGRTTAEGPRVSHHFLDIITLPEAQAGE